MNMWERLSKKINDEGHKYKTPFLQPDQLDVNFDANPISEGTAYCKLWLVEMRLAKEVEWLKDRYPVVYTATRYIYKNKKITIPYIASVDFFKGITKRDLNTVISQNFELTPLFPFTRGVIEFQAGLFSMEANNLIGSFVKIMEQFSRLLPVPELSTVINIIDPLYSGIEILFNEGKSRMEVGFQQTFSSAGGGGSNDLKPGYFAIIYAKDSDFDSKDLRVIDDSLMINSGPDTKPLPLTGYSYMLFRIEKRLEQDWEAISSLKELVSRAQDAIISSQQDQAKELLIAIKVAIARSPDIVKQDRKIIYSKIEAELQELGLEGVSERTPIRSLYQILQRPNPTWNKDQSDDWEKLENLMNK